MAYLNVAWSNAAKTDLHNIFGYIENQLKAPSGC
jgi:plasmid stabilization system protein ParE